MRHQKRVAKLGRTASHKKALLMNLSAALIQHGKIKTTDAKAKELRKVIERLITYGKKGTVHHRRLAFKVLHDRTLVKTLFDHIAPQYADRNGGYTRIVKLGFRDNDRAAVSLIEFVDYKHPGENKKVSKPVKKDLPKKSEVKDIKKKPVKKESEKSEPAKIAVEQTDSAPVKDEIQEEVKPDVENTDTENASKETPAE
jgi:large subunit ribosomal protein L17